MKSLVDRRLVSELAEAFRTENCLLLTGPRQVGKTTLARLLCENLRRSHLYLDLEQREDLELIEDFSNFVNRYRDHLVVLDEAQIAEFLFPLLRRQLDDQIETNEHTKWLLLGSATKRLREFVSENLGGRFRSFELAPFELSEIPALETASPYTSTANFTVDEVGTAPVENPGTLEALNELWLRGGYPRSYLAEDPVSSLGWRREYLQSVFNSPSDTSRPDLVPSVWEILCGDPGGISNFDSFGSVLGCKRAVIDEIVRQLVISNLVRELRSWHSQPARSYGRPSKYYIRDSGLLHANWGFADIAAVRSSDISGASWEGFVIEMLLLNAPYSASPFYYRNQDGDEIDLVLQLSREKKLAIEIKLSDTKAVSSGFYRACEQIGPSERFVVHGGEQTVRNASDSTVDALCLQDAINLVRRI